MGLPGIVWMFVILIVARYGTLLVLDGIVYGWYGWYGWWLPRGTFWTYSNKMLEK